MTSLSSKYSTGPGHTYVECEEKSWDKRMRLHNISEWRQLANTIKTGPWQLETLLEVFKGRLLEWAQPSQESVAVLHAVSYILFIYYFCPALTLLRFVVVAFARLAPTLTLLTVWPGLIDTTMKSLSPTRQRSHWCLMANSTPDAQSSPPLKWRPGVMIADADFA